MSSKILEAVKNCHYSQLDLFIRHNYNFGIKSQNDGCNCLLTALKIPDPRKRYRMFEFLLNQELVDILDQDKNGHDVFFMTVIRECERELDLLMKYFHMEIDWSRADNFGKTLLHYAVANNNLKILETLLIYCSKYKINVDIPDKINKIT
jgi:ankyrin repeat protein